MPDGGKTVPDQIANKMMVFSKSGSGSGQKWLFFFFQGDLKDAAFSKSKRVLFGGMRRYPMVAWAGLRRGFPPRFIL